MIAELREENEKLKGGAVDYSQYESWNSEQISQWILGICDGDRNRIFAKYDKVIQEQLEKQHLRGIDLKDLNKNDLMSFGINSFSDRNVLYKHIQMLINNEGGKFTYC